MLVVTSNWCMSDGSLAAGPPRACIERFRTEVRRAALRCGMRHDGRYRPVEAIDVVLAGDTFDWLVSRQWTGDLRPWHVGRRADAARERVVVGAFRRGERLLATLAAWGRNGIGVPVADGRGRPMPKVCRSVPVRVVVLRGDRDRWLEQAAPEWTRSHPAGPAVGRCWSDGVVTVRHGDEMDPLHAASACDPTLGESLAVDLIARFGAALHDIGAIRPLAGCLVRRLAGGSAVDASRTVTTWLENGGEATAIGESARGRIRDAWHRSIALWHQAVRRLSIRADDGVDVASRVAEWLHSDMTPAGRGPRRWIDPFPAAAVAFPWDSAAHVVLGHRADDAGVPPAWRRRLTCLGAGASPCGGRRDDDLESPAAVVVRPDREGRRFEWLPIENIPGGVHRPEDDESGHAVWKSPPSWLGGIVDAA